MRQFQIQKRVESLHVVHGLSLKHPLLVSVLLRKLALIEVVRDELRAGPAHFNPVKRMTKFVKQYERYVVIAPLAHQKNLNPSFPACVHKVPGDV